MALVWTKGDVDVAAAMEAQIRKAVASHSSSVPEFIVSVSPCGEIDAAERFRELFDWVLCAKRAGVDLATTEACGHDPLFRFGRR